MFSPDHPASSWALLTQAQRDAAYNNSAAVPDSARHVAARNAASAACRSDPAHRLDLAYGPGAREAWDIYPGSAPDAPCLVFIHGGYWQMNAREDFACFGRGLAAHGWAVAMPGYTLAPEADLTTIAGQILRALDWLAEEGPRHGAGGRILVSGWSAGAQLAALALAHPAVAAGLAISGVYELGPLRDTYLDAKLHLSDQEIETLSPLRLPVVDKALVLAYGSAELPALVEDARAFHARRARAHAPGALLPVPHADHYTVLDQLAAPDGLLTCAALELM
jgi:arylformamidase